MLHSRGSAVAAAIALGVNIHQTSTQGVATSVYITFIVIMSSSIVIGGLFVVRPRNVVRNDGTHIAIFKPQSIGKEFKEMLKVFIDPRILILTPAIFIGEFASAIVSSVNGMFSPSPLLHVDKLIYLLVSRILFQPPDSLPQ